MFLNGVPGRTGPGIPGPYETYFDFAVAERPKYVPGAGPPLAPITPMPAHDKDGVILDLIQINGEHRYVVGYNDKHFLKVGVKLQNILDWVSPRTHEDWEYARTVEREDMLEAATLPRIKAKQEKKRKIEKLTGKASRETETETETEMKSGKRKKTTLAVPKETLVLPGIGLGLAALPPSGPGRRRKSVAEEQVFTSPKASQKTSLPSPNKQRGLADLVEIESDEEEEDIQVALQMQFNAGFAAHSMRGLDSKISYSRSTSTSQEPNDPSQPAEPFKLKPRSAPHSRLRESSRPTSSTSSSATSNKKHKERRNSRLGGSQAVAATSSRAANIMYEKLERQNKAKFIKPGQTISQTYSYQPKPKKEPTPPPVDEDEDYGEEYAIDRILDDEMRQMDDGTIVTFYQIKWAGDWENTWEPADCVGHGAIKEYKRLKRKQKKHQKAKKPSTERTMDLDGFDDGLLELGKNGKAKKQLAPRGDRHDDENNNDVKMLEQPVDAGFSDEDSLFVSQKPRFPSERGDRPKGKEVVSVPPRGEVIDDGDDDDDDDEEDEDEDNTDRF